MPARPGPNGTREKYDAWGRVSERDGGGDGTRYRFRYDERGQLAELDQIAAGAVDSTVFRYDRFGDYVEARQYDGDKRPLDGSLYVRDDFGKEVRRVTFTGDRRPAHADGFDGARGVLVTGGKGPLRHGDVLVSFAGRRLDRPLDLAALKGIEGELVYYRDGEKLTIKWTADDTAVDYQ